jgi:hypothetical protein
MTLDTDEVCIDSVGFWAREMEVSFTFWFFMHGFCISFMSLVGVTPLVSYHITSTDLSITI